MKALRIVFVMALITLAFNLPSRPVHAATVAAPSGVAIMWCEYSPFLIPSPSQKNFLVTAYDAPSAAPQIATDGSVSCSAALGQLLAAGYAIHRTEANAANNGDPMFVLVTPTSLANVGN